MKSLGKQVKRRAIIGKVENQEERYSEMVKQGRNPSDKGDMCALRINNNHMSGGPAAEHGWGDRSPRTLCKVRALGKETCGDSDSDRVTILKRNNWSEVGKRCEQRTTVNNPIIIIQLPRGGQKEVRHQAHKIGRAFPKKMEGRAPPKKREEWTPYTSPTEPAPLSTSRRAKKKNPLRDLSKNSQRGQRGSRTKTRRVESTRWYSSSPVPDDGVMPFRRKRSVSLHSSVSWADDEYWACWDSWDEIIQWGNEVMEKDKQQKQRIRKESEGLQWRKTAKDTSPDPEL